VVYWVVCVCDVCSRNGSKHTHTHSSYKLCWQCNEAHGTQSQVSLFIRYIVIVCVKVCGSGKQWFEVIQKLQPYVWCVCWCDVWLCVCEACSLFRTTKHNQTTNNTTHNERTHLHSSFLQQSFNGRLSDCHHTLTWSDSQLISIDFYTHWDMK